MKNFSKFRCYPQYLPIVMSEAVTQRFPRYRLLAYTEAANKNVERLSKVKLGGTPVLFIPDMAGPGSYKVG